MSIKEIKENLIDVAIAVELGCDHTTLLTNMGEERVYSRLAKVSKSEFDGFISALIERP